MSKTRVLFLCTGNSCRSQMAEAIVNDSLGDRWEAFSAGSQPTWYVNPLTLKVLSEIGIDHHGRSKSVEEFQSMAFDLVVTMCDTAEEECPIWLKPDRRIHLPYPDPARVAGSEAEVMDAFRAVRNRIAEEIPNLLAGI